MSEEIDIKRYLEAAKDVKAAILKSRYTAAALVNRELLVLYYFVGKYVSLNTRNKNWGKDAVEKISSLLQQELMGLRGFSTTNLKNMRIFYEECFQMEAIFLSYSHVPLFDFMETANRQMPSDDLPIEFRQMSSDELVNVSS